MAKNFLIVLYAAPQLVAELLCFPLELRIRTPARTSAFKKGLREYKELVERVALDHVCRKLAARCPEDQRIDCVRIDFDFYALHCSPVTGCGTRKPMPT